jgi:hypothetical protein
MLRRISLLSALLLPAWAQAQVMAPVPVITPQPVPQPQPPPPQPVAQPLPPQPVAALPVSQAPQPVMAQILEAVRLAYSKQERPMVVLDLEGTLFDNRSRILQILKEYGEQELKSVRPDAARILAGIGLQHIQYMLPDTLRGVGITEEAVINNAAVFWSNRFFSDDYIKYDTPTPGAVKFVRELYSAGARIVYLTGRDAPRQLIGTVRQLRDAGLPIGIQGSELIMRPTMQSQDAIFKQQVTNYLRHYGKVIAAFDNEAANANIFRRAFPEALCVLFNAQGSPNQPPALPNIIAISAFE